MSQRHEAMCRLGAPFVMCPTCTKSFRGNRWPRHWIHAYSGGELVEHEHDDLCCSESCAIERCNELNAQEAAQEQVASARTRRTRTWPIHFSYSREDEV